MMELHKVRCDATWECMEQLIKQRKFKIMEIEEAIRILFEEAQASINNSKEKSLMKQEALALVKSFIDFSKTSSAPDTPMPDYIPEEPTELDS